MKKKLEKQIINIKKIPNIWRNLSHFVESVCLLVVSGYSAYSSFTYQFGIDNAEYLLRFAAFVIGLRGAWEILKHFDKETK